MQLKVIAAIFTALAVSVDATAGKLFDLLASFNFLMLSVLHLIGLREARAVSRPPLPWPWFET